MRRVIRAGGGWSRIIRWHRHEIAIENRRRLAEQRHQQNRRQSNRLQRNRNRQRAPPNFSLALPLLRISVDETLFQQIVSHRTHLHTKFLRTTWENLRRRSPAWLLSRPRRRARRVVRVARVLSCLDTDCCGKFPGCNSPKFSAKPAKPPQLQQNTTFR